MSRIARRALTVAVTVTLTGPLTGLVPGPAPAADAAPVPSSAHGPVRSGDEVAKGSGTTDTAASARMRLRAAVRSLPVARERNRGYDRDKFRDWYDADGDCRDTRDEVLAQESRVRVSGCDVQRGRWRSYYDRQTWRDSSDVDIDHMVPLAEAWGSGARRWTAGTRDRFANDLRDRRSLAAVTDNVNQSKGDGDPAEWLPQFSRCRYVREYTAVKLRWSLRVNTAERSALARVASRCDNVVIRWRPATIRRTGS